MKRIDTPNSIIIWNGTDRGFNDTPGPPPTELDAAWCNNVQESLTRPLDQQNIVLDGANFDQWTDMLQSYAFSGTPTIATGGVLTVQSGGQLGLAAGSIFTSAAGVTFSLLGNVTIGTTSANTLTIESTFDRVILASMGITGATGGNPVDFPEGATVAAGKDLGLGAASTISGDDTTVIDVGRVVVLDLEYDDAGTNLPVSPLRVRWNTTTPTVHMPDGTIRSWPIPARGKDLVFATAGAIASTTAIATARIQETEEVRIEFTFDYEHTGGLLGTLNTRIEVNGTPGTIDIDTLAHLLPTSGGVRWRDKTLIFYWRPDDDFIAPGTEDYQFTVRIGSSLGLTLNVRNIDITVESAIFV